MIIASERCPATSALEKTSCYDGTRNSRKLISFALPTREVPREPVGYVGCCRFPDNTGYLWLRTTPSVRPHSHNSRLKKIFTITIRKLKNSWTVSMMNRKYPGYQSGTWSEAKWEHRFVSLAQARQQQPMLTDTITTTLLTS
ncbi:uncharacterized protein LOC121598458 [Anopheles merus]|uniref:uncharacterized protein LOC121598458 n=1 Tax=Anopheles merus TaxID=30066 RepID=UPI001BE42DB5|nr:uncharacterized protein LOC121598458 [Anopheles merus]